ncbi:MAG: hypothetical protein AMJ72_03435 [Acidithiobacillales bacterium SM1_46]|nr:MAG: hypothetical protein AMJ72_03435 [Acidithiobacillales bacterium SM1_46]
MAFHGDPVAAGVTVFSDGNHHMALADALQQFYVRHPQVRDVFYATTPPGVLTSALAAGGFSLGNLFLSARPHLFISPAPILDQLLAKGLVATHEPFMRSRGNVLLVRAGNPRAIHSARDLARAEVRIFLSNPETESASYQVYAETLARHARGLGVTFDFLESGRSGRVVYGLRYTRIFPGCFEIISLDGSADISPAMREENVVTVYHLGLVGQGGEWGAHLRDFLQHEAVTRIYRHHGLERP